MTRSDRIVLAALGLGLSAFVSSVAQAGDEFKLVAAQPGEQSPDQPAGASSTASDAPNESSQPASEPYAGGVNPNARFAFSNQRLHEDPVIFWKGFLSGLRGFEQFYAPVGNPLYFETPFNTSELRFVYLNHNFADGSQLQGGNLNVVAMQARVALTERLGFIATKDGYSWLDAGLVPSNNGWNSVSAGLKYAFYVDRENELVMNGGVRYMMESGESKVFQGGVQELSPFISAAKGWDRFHLIGDFTWRAPLDSDDGNNIIQWDIHADYEILPETLKGFAPFLELHGLHYLDDGNRLPLSVGGLDYNNWGSTDVAGSTVIWFGVGARYKFSPHASIGADFEYPLTNRNADIMGSRWTVDFILNW